MRAFLTAKCVAVLKKGVIDDEYNANTIPVSEHFDEIYATEPGIVQCADYLYVLPNTIFLHASTIGILCCSPYECWNC